MELFSSAKIQNKDFDYSVKFNRTMKTFRYFDDFMNIVGNAAAVKYDLDSDSWFVSAYTYDLLVALDEKLFPKESDKVETKTKKVKALDIATKNVSDYESMGADMKLQPYEYQKRVIKFAVDTETALIVSPCGSGK